MDRPALPRDRPSLRELRGSNLAVRLITAALVAPLILLLLYFGPAWGWFALVLAASALGAVEFFAMTHPGDRIAQGVGILLTLAVSATLYGAGDDPRALLALLAGLPIAAIVVTLFRLGDIGTAATRMAATAFGPLWLGTLTFLALLRRDQGTLGPGYVLMTLMFAWLADTGGYFAGRFFGRRKLYEAVSPKKTVEGFAGALGGAVAGALLAHFWYLPQIPLGEALALAPIAGTLGQLGDLGESLLKRSIGVKDSGDIVPGHGGILDRVDALFITSAIVYLYTRFR
jgi:phosphatidate cytidylyltransferase